MRTADIERGRDLDRVEADWSWEADDRLRLTRLCDRFAGATGQPPFDYIGKPLFDLGALPEELVAACERREAFQAVPVAVGANSLPYGLSGFPAFDDRGLFQGYRGTASRRAAGENGDVRAAFLANVSHEFRTPLNAIIGFAEAMDNAIYGPLSDRYAGYARDIAQAGRHLLALVDDILDASAIEHGDARIEPRRISAGAMIDKAVSIVSVAAEARSIAVSRQPVAPDLAVFADERRLCQILVNLLGNAIKFTPEGGRSSLAARALDDGRVAIEVADNGPGIAIEDQQRIFEKFERLETNPFIRRDGAGLGLAIARELAQLMSGTLAVDSAPGEGARFTLTLPAA